LACVTKSSQNTHNIKDSPFSNTIDKKSCHVCFDALSPNSKNRRNNTSLLIRYIPENKGSTSTKNIVIDCGKTFYHSALQWFTHYKITRLDAVLLTHEHADAVFGLDELREWSGPENPLDVYLSQRTYKAVRSMFPYLVDPKKATGGGKVSILNFITFDDDHPTPLDVWGLSIIPIRVVHGEMTLHHPLETLDRVEIVSKVPSYAFGYRFEDITYISDVSEIPDESNQLIMGSRILILDALFDIPGLKHKSHFSVDEALNAIKIYHVETGILTGLGHTIEHEAFQKRLDDISSINEDIQELFVAYDGMLYEIHPKHDTIS
jgi:phosphoribosyl 1,2-cyclic phosphodiesterase